MEEAEFSINDTVVAGITDDKIQAKITKEGNSITLDQGMEIAILEVAMQGQLSQM